MKKFNTICILCMLLMLAGIIQNFLALDTGVYPIYYRVMLVINGVLFGMAIGEFYLGNMIVKHKCNFDQKGGE